MELAENRLYLKRGGFFALGKGDVLLNVSDWSFQRQPGRPSSPAVFRKEPKDVRVTCLVGDCQELVIFGISNNKTIKSTTFTKNEGGRETDTLVIDHMKDSKFCSKYSGTFNTAAHLKLKRI